VRAAVPPLLVLALLAAVLASAPAARAQEVFGSIDGPAALAPGQTAQYNVTILGGPAGNVNYTINYYLQGLDLAGGSPTKSSPARASGNRTEFSVNVTAPQKDQTVTLVVKISAQLGSVTENGTAEASIQVITPIALSATFHNASPTAALNVTVRFYVDDRLVGTRKIDRIGANADVVVTHSWIPLGLEPGTHRVRVEADLDGNGVIDPSRGEVATSDLFYRQTAPLSAGWTVLVAIAIAVPAFLVTVALRRRGQQR